MGWVYEIKLPEALIRTGILFAMIKVTTYKYKLQSLQLINKADNNPSTFQSQTHSHYLQFALIYKVH